MASDVSCFDDIIGLTRTPCSDYTGLSTDYTTSDSGLYLDELIPLSKFEAILNCKVGENVFTFMEKARDNAIIDFRIDATAILTEYNKIKRRPFSGRIGKVKRADPLSLTVGKYYGIVLRVDDVVGGEILVSDIATMFDTTGTVTVYVYNNLNTLLGTYVLNTTANTVTANAISILTLPMHSDYVENLEYSFVFLLGANVPYDNELYNTCTSLCNSDPTQSNKQFGFTDYMRASGITLTDLLDFSDLRIPSDNRCFGLSLGLKARCKVDEIWCYDEMDYIGDAVDMAVAKAVRLKAASNLIRDIALSENLNFETMIDGETLGEMDERWMGEYNEMIEFIVKNIDVTKTDCFECGREILMGSNTIWS
jgi:hypothetical protein